VPDGRSWVLDPTGWKGLPPELAGALESVGVVTHGAKEFLVWLARGFGCGPQNVWCTRSAARVLWMGDPRGDGLHDLLADCLGIPRDTSAPEIDWGSLFLGAGETASVADEAARVLALRDWQVRATKAAGLEAVCRLEMDLIPVVAGMELAGLPAEATALRAAESAAQSAMAECEAAFRSRAGRASLNLSSPKQVLAALQSAGLKISDTNEQTLLAVGDAGLVGPLLAFRGHQKIAQLAAGLRAAIRADGRIHARFDPLGTDTGRFSCDSPNLQNIPHGPLRAAITAPPGSVFVRADYSQIELRAVAALAGDPEMLGAFHRGDDLHRATAAAILGKPAAMVTPSDRQLAKSVNFGLIYGQGAEGLVRSARQRFGVELTVEEAMKFRDRFFAHYAQIARWHSRALRMAGEGAPETRTALGRRRLIPGGANRWGRFTALVNAPVQGGSADGMKAAMVALAKELPPQARIVCTIHDELVAECPESIAEAVAETLAVTMRRGMQDLYPDVPIVVETSAGRSWEG